MQLAACSLVIDPVFISRFQDVRAILQDPSTKGRIENLERDVSLNGKINHQCPFSFMEGPRFAHSISCSCLYSAQSLMPKRPKDGKTRQQELIQKNNQSFIDNEAGTQKVRVFRDFENADFFFFFFRQKSCARVPASDLAGGLVDQSPSTDHHAATRRNP
jgi:hypothetical protein